MINLVMDNMGALKCTCMGVELVGEGRRGYEMRSKSGNDKGMESQAVKDHAA